MKNSLYLCPVNFGADQLNFFNQFRASAETLKLRNFSVTPAAFSKAHAGTLETLKGLYLDGKKTEIIEAVIGSFLENFGNDHANIACLGLPIMISETIDLDLNLELAKNLSLNPVAVINGEGKTKEEIQALSNYITEKSSGLAGIVVANSTETPKHDMLLTESFDANTLTANLEKAGDLGTTFKMFESSLIEKVKANPKRHIILPEGNDDRVLRAADELLRKGIVDITILGKVEEVNSASTKLGLDLSKANIVDPLTSEKTKDYANKLYELRKAKGLSEEDALKLAQDETYYATMMLKENDADGMVSGACHSTGDTVRPALQIIKTVPGTSVVSSVFFMCLYNRVVLYGDCAINPNPTEEQMAEIAIASAETAISFGMEPKVAFLSYSTGASGAGPDVDFVKKAVSIAKEKRPDLKMDGPIQYDAAVNPGVGQKKMPGSEVAGHANVIIFPELNSGNMGYKIAQREGQAEAIGPMLQGLNKPMNDLSRGCFVQDIVNTVYLTAIQVRD